MRTAEVGGAGIRLAIHGSGLGWQGWAVDDVDAGDGSGRTFDPGLQDPGPRPAPSTHNAHNPDDDYTNRGDKGEQDNRRAFVRPPIGDWRCAAPPPAPTPNHIPYCLCHAVVGPVGAVESGGKWAARVPTIASIPLAHLSTESTSSIGLRSRTRSPSTIRDHQTFFFNPRTLSDRPTR